MSINYSIFDLVVKVEGDSKTLIQAKKDIEAIIQEIQKIKGVEVRRKSSSMLITTNPEGLI